MKLKRLTVSALLASLAAVSAMAPIAAHADGLLQKGDITHPLPAFQVQTPGGTLVNGDALVMHFLQGSTNLTGTGTFAQSTDPSQSGAEVFTFSAGDMSGLSYGYVLCQPVDTTTPGNIINPYLVNLVAFNPYDPSLLGLTGVATAAGQTTNGATLNTMAAILAKFQFDTAQLLKVNTQVLPATPPAGYGGAGGGAPVIHR